jgi:hypothetical protein
MWNELGLILTSQNQLATAQECLRSVEATQQKVERRCLHYQHSMKQVLFQLDSLIVQRDKDLHVYRQRIDTLERDNAQWADRLQHAQHDHHRAVSSLAMYQK